MMKTTFLLLLSSLFITAEPIEDFTKLKEEIQLVKKTERPKHYNKRLSGIKNPKAVEVAKQTTFKNWKTYEDEFISFKYPDSEFIRLDKEDKKYRLMIENEIYLSLSLSENNDFEYWECACGAVIYEKFHYHNSALYRFGFLSHGEVKKIQVQKGGYLITTQWTHELIPQSLYLDLMFSVKLKKGTKANSEKLQKRANNSGTLSFAKGMTQQDVISLIGESTEKTKDQLKFIKTASYDWNRNKFKETETINFVNGKIEFIAPDWSKSEEILVKGTIDWIKHIIDKSDNSESANKLDKETIRYIKKRVAELIPRTKNSGNYSDWDTLCNIIESLFEQGHEDEEIKSLFRLRAFKNNMVNFTEGEIIQKYDCKNWEKFIEKKMLELLKTNKLGVLWEYYADDKDRVVENYFYELMNAIDEDSHTEQKLIMKGLDNPNDDIRSYTYGYLCYLIPNKESYPYFVKELNNYDDTVRRECAEVFAVSLGTKDDIPLLEKQLKFEQAIQNKDETNKEIIENLKKAIKRLKEKE